MASGVSWLQECNYSSLRYNIGMQAVAKFNSLRKGIVFRQRSLDCKQEQALS